MKYFFNSILSKAYWRYIFSIDGIKSILAIYGFIWLIIESLDFFNVYTRDQYANYAFFIFIVIATLISILLKRPIKSILIPLKGHDFNLEVRIADLFDVSGAAVISSNTVFEADVASGKISVNSLQGQFTAKYFTGNQNKLIEDINEELKEIDVDAPYPMGTTIPIHTHGKTFYFTAMAVLGENGNASSTVTDIKNALDGLWKYVRNSGELQELAVPVIGTGRGRIKMTRKKMIALIAESFVKESINNKFTEKLIITVRPEDADNFGINLYDIKDHLNHVLK
ncbi:DUF6430 domain-containing protein [Zhouia spongiae]|uniref:DUF6430 domain-containing protein n=1 Tax=Zhouia spongiae TaxID=2202721 RepID=A0ABY3YKI9_9FLAO|nr:macro domain-containing protein [Zhouia spongiae]UNY98354.1 DUF6430 domain-containing protein [Zhouia spongiae]